MTQPTEGAGFTGETGINQQPAGSPVGASQEQESAQQAQSQEVKHNPAWDAMLGQLPTQLHPIVTPHLKEWDRNFNSKLQEVHSRYEGFKPFIENNVTPDMLVQALQLRQLITNQPETVYNALVSQFGFGEQGQQEEQEEEQEEGYEQQPNWTKSPEFQQVAQMAQEAKAFKDQQEQALLDQQATEQLDKEFAEAKAAAEKNHLPYDEAQIARIMYAGQGSISAMQALDIYAQEWLRTAQAMRRPDAPTVMGSGGGSGLPNPEQKPRTAEERRAQVRSMLEAAKNQQ